MSDSYPRNPLEDSFAELPAGTLIYYLDTSVWSELVKKEDLPARAAHFLETRGCVAALSYFTLFELSRAPRIFDGLEKFLLKMKHNVWIPLLYDQVIEAEVANYPEDWTIRWMPISLLVDQEHPHFLKSLSNNELFVSKRDEHLQFGVDEFMRLEQFKQNFPFDHDGKFHPKDADKYAWADAVLYLGRHFPSFVRRFKENPSAFRPERIPSLHVRSLYVYYKYYVHGQSPKESDFMDCAHLSYAPYCNAYVTERNAYYILNHIKSSGAALSDCVLFRMREFFAELRNI